MLACRDIDALMMDWLYQELEPSQAGPFDDHVAGCPRCQGELEAMKRTRAALRDLPEAEPPASITAILMHEAARKAPTAVAVEPAGGGGRRGLFGWLSGLFMPISQHPAAAALATLVLVAGVAGALYVRGEHRVAEPRTDSAAPPPEVHALMPGAASPAAPEAEPEPTAQAEGRYHADQGITARLEEDNDLTGGENNADAPAQEERGEVALDLAKPGYKNNGKDVLLDGKLGDLEKKKEVAHRKIAADKKPAPVPLATESPTTNAVSGADQIVTADGDDAARDRASGGRGDTGGQRNAGAGGAPAGTVAPTGGTVADKREGERQQTQPPPPPAKPAEVVITQPPADSNAPGLGQGTYRVYLQNPQDNAYVTSKEAQLDQAAKKKDCLTAARIANDILDRSYDYYVANVQAKPIIKTCNMYVQKERQTRQANRRAMAAKKAGGAGSAKGSKASQAKPAKADAAEAADSN